MDKLLEKILWDAVVYHCGRMACGRGLRDHPDVRKWNAADVGKGVLELPQAERDALRNATAADFNAAFARKPFFGYGAFMRPDRPGRDRKRSPSYSFTG